MWLPYQVDVPMERMPFANWALIGATTVLSVVALLDHGAKTADLDPNVLTQSWEKWHSAAKYQSLNYRLGIWRGEDFRVWQLFTSVMVHADLLHLLGNMYFLFVFGNAINAKLGQFWYLLAYFGIGALESLVWLGLGAEEVALGASGAICGVMGMFLVFYPRNDVAMFRFGLWEWRILPESISAGWLVLLYIIWDIWGAATRGHDDWIGNFSHWAGTVLGIALAVLLLKTKWIDAPYGEENLLQVFGWEPAAERGTRSSATKLVTKKTKPKTTKRTRLEKKPRAEHGDVHGWG